MKKINKALIIVICIVLILFLPGLIVRVSLSMSSSILERLKGEIYYTKRVDGVLTLFKADANLKNERLIYSNAGKGFLNSGIRNDNIAEFRYYPETGIIEFTAVYSGKWSVLSIREGETEPTYVREPKEVKVLEDYRIVEVDTDYINPTNDMIKVYQKQGSLYILNAGEERCIKRFRGMYSEKFTGYRPVGLSPDGRYLIYSYLGAFLGTIVHDSKKYIMDLETGKITNYMDFFGDIQWVQ